MHNHDNTGLPGTEHDTSSDELLTAFIGPHAPYYLMQFAKFRLVGDNFVITWNWAGFFFPHIWLFYRKMYLFGIIALIASLTVAAIGWLCSGIIVGLCGNYAYYTHAAKKISSLRNASMPKENLLPAAQLLGGTHWVLALVILGILVIHMIGLMLLGALLFAPLLLLPSFGGIAV